MPIPELSPTEERIVLLAAQGQRKREIAALLGIDKPTVDWHLTQAHQKLTRASALLEQLRTRQHEQRGHNREGGSS